MITLLPSFVPSSACVSLWVVWRWRAHGNHFLNAPRNPPHQFGPKCVPGNLASMIPALPPIISNAPLKPLSPSLTSDSLFPSCESRDRTGRQGILEINKIFCQSSQNFKTWLGQEISLVSVGSGGCDSGESETVGETLVRVRWDSR